MKRTFLVHSKIADGEKTSACRLVCYNEVDELILVRTSCVPFVDQTYKPSVVKG